MTPEEKAVLEAAIAAHCSGGTTSLTDCAPESCGGSHLDPCDLHAAVRLLLAARRRGVLDAGMPSAWYPATFADVLMNDRIRLGRDEATVLRCTLGVWHADTQDAWRPRAWQHVELRMELNVNPGLQQYPPGTACEILCTPERLALLTLGRAFPGSTVIS